MASAKFLVVTPDVLEIAQAAVGGDKELQSVKIIVIGLTETATTRSMGIVPFNQLLQVNKAFSFSLTANERNIPSHSVPHFLHTFRTVEMLFLPRLSD